MKHLLLFFFIVFSISFVSSQENSDRIAQLRYQLESLEVDIPGLEEKINVDLQNTTLPNFLVAISRIHNVNINVSPDLNQLTVANNFNQVSVKDVLLFLCKEYNLTIDFTGSILSIKNYTAPIPPTEERIIPVNYNPNRESLSVDLQNDILYDVFKKITAVTGKNLVYRPGLENNRLTVFIQEMPIDAALDKLAFANNLILSKTRDNFYVFESKELPEDLASNNSNRPVRSRSSDFYYKILDTLEARLDVDFENTPIATVVYDISNELHKDYFLASPLEAAGNASLKAQNITYDEMLKILFEGSEGRTQSQASDSNQSYPSNSAINNQNQQVNPSNSSGFSYKKIDGIYFFGAVDQLSVRSVQIIPLMHRSIELMDDPIRTGRTAGRTVGFNQNYSGFNNTNFGTSNYQDGYNNSGTSQYTNTRRQSQNYNDRSENSGNTDFLEIIPDEVKNDLDIRVDKELNSFFVSGPSINVERFKKFIADIDKPVPVILIEVMILEISRNATLEAGVEWGLGTEATQTQGKLFPDLDVKLGANTVNKILGRIDGSSFFNIGTVMPNFFAAIKAQETNGNFKVKSSPRIATLNGHRAYFSNGQTSYYAVTNQTFIGSQNPATSEITNYQPIDAELSLDVRPIVSGDGIVTMDMKVIQSNFNGERIAEGAPPGINSREFTSLVKARNNDIIVLGGLEERSKDDTGTGVPFLSKIPILKWLFSKRTRTDKRAKLTVLIKPTIIY
ncbi:type IV pilus assembly protein PilQ [Leeuwenhoekiella aestuarii]|uniref:type II secretion system protein GspD n=1 Tax=Leeuwenhoekiella aestuarii TaxID=2249426 RepID=UPI000FFE9799|nr:type II and III secretion system protein [Leeuwenhoekiella aestuarii]RXG11482.1 type IV pilus assembly protein PilQ [Leeuwenhoekiella aestuarii]